MRANPPEGRWDGQRRTLTAGGLTRSYRLHRPAGLGRSGAVPLVLMLHGGFGNGAQAEAAYGWDAAADAYGFVVAYPDGIGRSWNAGVCCGPARDGGVDDVGFLWALVQAVGAAEGVDPDRVYVTGISNGAMMAYRLACDLPGSFAAIGPVAGSLMVACPQPPPTSILHVHGLEDHNVPFAGGIGRRAREPQARPSVPSIISRWREAAGCGPVTMTERYPVRTETAVGSGGVEVALITVAGAGHQWPGGRPAPPRVVRMLRLDQPSPALDATAVLWSFFAAHPRVRRPN